MPDRILIVADDLTGACDSAAAFLASGHSVRVLPEASAMERMADRTATVLAVSTESRDLTVGQAAERVSDSIAHLLGHGSGFLLFKKIDSAARGAFAAEIEAALRTSGAALALVTPAFPAVGRTVVNGVLSVRDWTGQDTKITLSDLFAAADVSSLAVLPASSESDLHDAIARAIDRGIRILLCDAAEQLDLDRLATAALRIPQRILWAGSAGLARALAAQLPTEARCPAHVPYRTGRTLLFTGTLHPVTALQVAYLERASRGTHARAIHHLAETGAAPEGVVAAFTSGPESPAALILTGGDTASFVLRALSATAIRVAGEVAPGIPWGIIEGGLADGCTVVTKSGGFGQQDALVRAFEFCESDFCESEVSVS